MIIGLITDIPALQGSGGGKPLARLPQNGTDFARVLAGLDDPAQQAGFEHPESPTHHTQTEGDLADTDQDPAQDFEHHGLADAPVDIVEVSPDDSFPDMTTIPTTEVQELQSAEQHVQPRTDAPRSDFGITYSPAPAGSDNTPPAQNGTSVGIGNLQMHDQGQYQPSRMAQVASGTAQTPPHVPSPQPDAGISGNILGALSGDELDPPAAKPAHVKPVNTAAWQWVLNEAGAGPQNVILPRGMAARPLSTDQTMTHHVASLRVQPPTAAGSETSLAFTNSEVSFAQLPAAASLARPPSVNWAREMIATMEKTHPDMPLSEPPTTMIDVLPIGATDGTANLTNRATMPVLRNDATLSAGLAQAIQAASVSGEAVFEVDILDGLGGKLRVSVSAIDGSVQISMLAGRADMLDMLKRSLNLLAADLTELGFKDVDLTLSNQGGNAAAHHVHIVNTAPAGQPETTAETRMRAPSSGMDLRL